MYYPNHELDSMGAIKFANALATLQARTPQRASVDASNMMSQIAQGAQLAQLGLHSASGLSGAASIEAIRGNDTIYGIDSGAAGVGAGVTATLTVTPQKRHVPVRIVLGAATAAAFVITDIRAGVEPILSTVGAISAAIFIQDATAPNFRSVVMEVGMDFSVTVTNITGANARFTVTVVGSFVPSYIG